MEKIDLVVPYVDSSDKNWQALFNKYNPHLNKNDVDAKNRFRGQGDFFRYFFRCIDKNLPWINRVHLLVQSESQVPSWLDKTKVHVVLHEDFIPKEYLPIFNSGTIEMFLQNIPELEEHFIYTNDDIYALKPLLPENFFKDGKLLFNYLVETKKPERDWYYMCQKNHDLIYGTKNSLPYYRLDHEFRPYLKSRMIEVFNEHKDAILNSISRFRSTKNLTVFLFSLDLIKNSLQEKTTLKNEYLWYEASKELIMSRLNDNDVICLNDTSDKINIYENSHIKAFFNLRFNAKSKYELYDVELVKNSRETSPVFGIISWFPDKEPDRSQRIERLNKMMAQLIELFGEDIKFMIVAQNWKNYKLPKNIKNVEIFKYSKLGILGARKTLGKHFLQSKYDYLIMCDDDIVLKTNEDFTKEYFFKELNKHPNGFMFIQYGWSLTFCAISKNIYKQTPMSDIDPEKGEGYEDTVWPFLLHYKHPKNEFNIAGIKFIQHHQEFHKNHKSTWDSGKVNHENLQELTHYYIERFKKGEFTINDEVKRKAKAFLDKYDWYQNALWQGWVTREDYDKFMKNR